MRKTAIFALAAAAVLAAGTASAQYGSYGRAGSDNALRFHVGLFTPDGDSTYWNDPELGLEANFTGDAESFEDLGVGADFRYALGERLSVLFSGELYSGEEDLAYRDFVDDQNRDIFHTTTLDIASLTAGLTFNLTGRGAAVVPYLGAGGGVYFWDLEESGDFIDFLDPLGPTIITATFQDDGEALGYYWLAGIEVPLGTQWSFFAEGRWHRVEDELSGEFADLGDLDLSGRRINGGFAWRF